MLKHVGRMAHNQRRIVVAYKVVPGEPENCIVVTTENLEAADHDNLMKLVESPSGQQADDLATVMMRTSLSDGSNMLARFHTTGKMVKVKTSTVEMVPNRNSVIMLDKLNEAIAAQKGVTVADMALKGKADPTVVATGGAPVITAEQMANPTPVAAPVDGVLTDDILAAQYRSQADALYKEAKLLRSQAEDLVPTVKKAAKKTTASA
jgi:hypothetical protein